jgi:hypothetical protein
VRVFKAARSSEQLRASPYGAYRQSWRGSLMAKETEQNLGASSEGAAFSAETTARWVPAADKSAVWEMKQFHRLRLAGRLFSLP